MKARDLGILAAKIAALTVLLMMVNGIGSRFLPGAETEGTGQISEAVVENAPAPPSASFMAIVLLVMLLQTIALAYPIVRSKWSGWKLALAMFLLYFGTVTFMGQIESLVYLGGKMPNGMLTGLFAMGLFSAAVFSPDDQPDGPAAAVPAPDNQAGVRTWCNSEWLSRDAAGHVHRVGRADDLIATRGELVSPVEVEQVLRAIPGIAAAAVIGVDDALLGQAVRACVVLEEGSALNARQIRRLCLAQLENFMVPTDVVLCPALPTTANGAVDKARLARPEW